MTLHPANVIRSRLLCASQRLGPAAGHAEHPVEVLIPAASNNPMVLSDLSSSTLACEVLMTCSPLADGNLKVQQSVTLLLYLETPYYPRQA
jgi:hypothetical protein